MKALLVRHANSADQAADAPLTAEGSRQAAALVPVLTALGAGPLYSSPYTRAAETIAPYAKASGQTVTTLDGLRERTLATVNLPNWREHMRRSFFDALHAGPGGESHTHLFVRAANAFAEIADTGGALPTFVTHGGLTAALFNRVDPSFGFDAWKDLRAPDLFEVEIKGRQIRNFVRREF
ncbi:MAG: histidine phosphatase family protein [Pseudomonadota bacterium]